jgi:DNA-binding HxlR family transcriptional regulator
MLAIRRERGGILERQACHEIPPRIEYRLAAKGREPIDTTHTVKINLKSTIQKCLEDAILLVHLTLEEERL